MQPLVPGQNVAWLIADRAIQFLNVVLVGAVVARHLGPTQLGAMAFATAVVSMIMPLTELGLTSIFLRDCIRYPERRRNLFWQTLWLKSVVGGLLVFLLFVYAYWADFDYTDRLLLAIASLTIVAHPPQLIRLVLQANLRSRVQVVINAVITVISAIVKIVLIFLDQPVVPFFIASVATEFVAVAALATFLLFRFGVGQIPRPQLRFAANLLRESWPLILAALGVSIYTNIDLAMLKSMRGDADVGIYSVAVRLSGIFTVLPGILLNSLAPRLTKLHHEDEAKYRDHLQNVFNLNAMVAVICVIAAQLFLPTFVEVLYGASYSESIPCFRIHIFNILFVFIGTARSQHLLLTGQHGAALMAIAIGTITNIGINLVLIPDMGPIGAAIATLVSYAVSGYFTTLLMRSGWELFKRLTKAFIPRPSAVRGAMKILQN